MILPVTSDTIIAAATGWSPSPLGILRLSGPRAIELAWRVREGGAPRADAGARVFPGHARAGEVRLPALTYVFRAPRSYTGQDVAEIHTVGCLPLLREMSDRLVEAGARRALPGEFTARAYLNGKLARQQIDAVHALIRALDDSSARAAARRILGDAERQRSAVRESLRDLLARVEAGIDFADEEDVRFVTPDEAARILTAAVGMLAPAGPAATKSSDWAWPRVALVGRPNAGKSTLFNALVGSERVIVSPVLGTTRDVVSADVQLHGRWITLQDTAGIMMDAEGPGCEIQRASQRVLDEADLVAWVHARGEPWTADERGAFDSLPRERCVLVTSKCDRSAAPHEPDSVRTSAATGAGLPELRAALLRRLEELSPAGEGTVESSKAVAALHRAKELTSHLAESPELVSTELREALAELDDFGRRPEIDETLGRIFRRFCVGK